LRILPCALGRPFPVAGIHSRKFPQRRLLIKVHLVGHRGFDDLVDTLANKKLFGFAVPHLYGLGEFILTLVRQTGNRPCIVREDKRC
jgi:hypothetical protein